MLKNVSFLFMCSNKAINIDFNCASRVTDDSAVMDAAWRGHACDHTLCEYG